MGRLADIDWAIVAGYLVLTLAVGLWASRSAGRSLGSYFVAALWRRVSVLTDAEFIELRYQGRGAASLVLTLRACGRGRLRRDRPGLLAAGMTT